MADKVLGVTRDGVRILKPRGNPDHFTQEEVREAVARVIAEHDGPGFWRNETSGVLRPVIEAYLNDQPLTVMQIAAMRAYLRQWINAPGWDRNPHSNEADRAILVELRRRVEDLTDSDAIDRWLHDADRNGYDPL